MDKFRKLGELLKECDALAQAMLKTGEIVRLDYEPKAYALFNFTNRIADAEKLNDVDTLFMDVTSHDEISLELCQGKGAGTLLTGNDNFSYLDDETVLLVVKNMANCVKRALDIYQEASKLKVA